MKPSFVNSYHPSTISTYTSTYIRYPVDCCCAGNTISSYVMVRLLDTTHRRATIPIPCSLQLLQFLYPDVLYRGMKLDMFDVA